jgi:hypothetical protein
MRKYLFLTTILIVLSACTTPITGDAQLKQEDIVASAKTQFKYVSGELRPQNAYNYYVSRTAQYARASILTGIIKKDYGEKYARKLAAQGSIEDVSPIQIVSVSEVSTTYSKTTDWRSFIYTTVDIRLSNGTSKRVKYKSTVALSASIVSESPIVNLTSFELLSVKNL